MIFCHCKPFVIVAANCQLGAAQNIDLLRKNSDLGATTVCMGTLKMKVAADNTADRVAILSKAIQMVCAAAYAK
jgi:hypothetical protein